MGSYLSEPQTEKESSDEFNDKLICGASSMQGWRCSQEDAHNCILDYDTNTSFFAVYDGHGGHEVAHYCSQNLPQFIKNLPEYKEGKIEEALVTGFLRFDAEITKPEVMEELKQIAGENEAEESDEEENVRNLYEEATMPIEQVIEKYTSNKELPRKNEDKTPKDSGSAVGTSSASCSSTSDFPEKCGDGVSSSSEADTNNKTSEAKNGLQDSVPEVDSSEVKEVVSTADTEEPVSTVDGPIQNGEISTPGSEAETKADVTSSTPPVENGTPSKKGKNKLVIKPEAVKEPVNTRPKRNARQLYKQWLDMGEDSEESDEEDQTFVGPSEESSEDETEGVNVAIEVSEEGSSAEEEEEDDENDDDEEEEDDEDGDEMAYTSNEVPGSDSGCTAVVALMHGNQLYVANAGDSRCIVCRNGEAIEMSIDHKPEDPPEYRRVVKAGGHVNFEGRVNGGLNLSRAIGDHAYKQNKELSDREQMITALPDIKTLTLNPEQDEFMVLACDGIWNSLSSQEVVDFVRPKIERQEKLSKICEEIFDHCLAPHTAFDGSGCDNMTAIIVKFKSSAKRAASPQSEQKEAKKAKTESEAQIDTTA